MTHEVRRTLLIIIGGVLIGAGAGAVAGCFIAVGAVMIIHALRTPR